MSAGSQTDFPQDPSSDYAETQRTLAGGAQSSARDEAEAGVQLVPRPEDVTSFETAAEGDVPVGGLGQRSGDAVGRSQDYDERQREIREKQVSAGHADQRHNKI